jgi:uncharacterized membrane protein
MMPMILELPDVWRMILVQIMFVLRVVMALLNKGNNAMLVCSMIPAAMPRHVNITLAANVLILKLVASMENFP